MRWRDVGERESGEGAGSSDHSLRCARHRPHPCRGHPQHRVALFRVCSITSLRTRSSHPGDERYDGQPGVHQANTAGNLIVVYVVWDNSGTVTVSDTRGDTYTAATARQTWGSNWSAQVFYAPNIVGGSNTVKATFGTAITSFGIVYLHEYSGLATAAPVDVSASAAGTSASMSSGAVTTSQANDLLFAAGASDNTVTQRGPALRASDGLRQSHGGSRRHNDRVLRRDRQPKRHHLGHAARRLPGASVPRPARPPSWPSSRVPPTPPPVPPSPRPSRWRSRTPTATSRPLTTPPR